ncbi:MAG: mechanosensitive ion channel [Prolixibacteraceae bacterium]|jgi:miniconductance mechanosensitive channel|nr:mechanosensitive ion channel [Prolixibacteraceae bacterium]
MQKLNQILYDWLFKISYHEELSQIVSTLIVGIGIVVIAFLLLYIVRRIMRSAAHRLAKSTKTEWDDILLKHNVFLGIAHFIPASIIYFTADFGDPFFEDLSGFIENISNLYFLFAAVFTIGSILSSVNEIYNKSFAFAKEKPIAGFVQLMKILMYFIAILLVVGILFDKDLGKLVTGLGAMAAVLMLIFRDSILGFVAGFQISMNNMVKIGDWISMPQRGADGPVTEINLTTVKVENWDKTITNLPTYSLVSESFVNWNGMEQSGGRRIMRSINIDMDSVRFCDTPMLEKFEKFRLIKDYVNTKQKEIEEFNAKYEVSPDEYFNGRRQTNLGVFRKYLEAYLHNHPMIRQEMTFLIRHLQPTEKGIPIQVYVFSKDNRWAYYEAIQADIFDHIIAILPEFGLRIFQIPSGHNFRELAAKQTVLEQK